MFKIESYLSPFLLNWLNSYVKLKNEDFKLSLWEGDAVFSKLDLRLEVIQNLLHLPFNISSGRIQELRIHVPWTKLGSEPISLTINTIEFVLSLPANEGKSSETATESISTEFERNAVNVQQDPGIESQQQMKQPSYLEAMIFKILNNVQITVNNLIVKYMEGDMIVSVNVKSAETWSADSDWNKAFVDVLPPKYGLRKIANLHDATICLDRSTPSGKIETYNEPFMYRCSLQCRMLFEYPSPYSRIPSAAKLAFFFGETEFSLADTQLPLLLRLIRTALTVVYGNSSSERQNSGPERGLSSSSISDEYGMVPPYPEPNSADDATWGSWAMSYLPGVLSWTTGLQGPMPLDGEYHKVNSSFTFVGVYAKKVTISLKLSKKHVDPLGTSSRIQFHPCVTVVTTGVKSELIWQGDSFFSCSVILSSLVGKTAGFCTCHVRDEGEQVISCGSFTLSQVPILFDHILDDTTVIPNTADEHLEKYSDEYISEMQPAFMLDFITDTDKSREKPDAPLEQLRRYQRAIFRWFVFHPTISLTGGLFHRMTKFLSHAQKSEFDLFSSMKSNEGGAPENPDKAIESIFSKNADVQTLDFNVCGRSDRVYIKNFTILAALNNHPCALPGKHSGIFAQKLSQVGSPIRLCAGNVVMAKTEPLYPLEIEQVLRAYSGPLNEDIIAPCCAQYVVECSNVSLDLPNESGASFAIACGLSFSITARNYAILDAGILNLAGLSADYVSFTMPGISLTFNYPCLLYISLLLRSYTVYDARPISNTAVPSGSNNAVSTGLEVLTTALLGMIYANLKESFMFSAGNVSIQKADFAHVHNSSESVSCLCAMVSSLRLDLRSDGESIPIVSFFHSDVPSVAVYSQWKPQAFSIQYVLATFSPITVHFSNKLNNILLSVDLNRYLESQKSSTGVPDSQLAIGKGSQSQSHKHQSAFRLLADVLASETVSTSKPAVRQRNSGLSALITALKGTVVNVSFANIAFNILDQLHLTVPRTTVTTPHGIRQHITQHTFTLAKPFEFLREESNLWTVKLENIGLRFELQHIFSPPLTICATLSAIQNRMDESLNTGHSREGLPTKHGSTPAFPIANHQLSLHVNIDTLSISLHRLAIKKVFSLYSKLASTGNMVSSQMSILPSPISAPNSPHGEDEIDMASQVQLWLQVTVPKSILLLYLDEETSEKRRIHFTLDTVTVSIDSHPTYQKARVKLQSLHGIGERLASAEWLSERSYFLMTNSELFEFENSCLPPRTADVGETDSFPHVVDDFVISVTSARVRDVFVHVHESSLMDPVVVRSTSGEPFSPSLGGRGSALADSGSNLLSGLTEICVSLPNLDVVVSQKAMEMFLNTSREYTIDTSPNVEAAYNPAFYLNSGVIRSFINLHSTLTSGCPYDYLLLCFYLNVTSDIQYFPRTRRQTNAAVDNSVANTTRSSTAVGNTGNQPHHCDNLMQISINKITAYLGLWSVLTQADSTSNYGRLSPHVMNNPALKWNLKSNEAAVNSSLFFSIFENPLDISFNSSNSGLEVFFKQNVDLSIMLNILPSLACWLSLFTPDPDIQCDAATKPFELTVLCPSLSILVCSSENLTVASLLKFAITRPQIHQILSSESRFKLSCQNIEIWETSFKSFKMFDMKKEASNFFSPVLSFMSKPTVSSLILHDPLNINLDAETLFQLSKLYAALRGIMTELSVILGEIPVPATYLHKTNIDTHRITLSYRWNSLTIQSSLSSLSIKVLTAGGNVTKSKVSLQLDKLLCFLINREVGYDHCIMHPTDIEASVENGSFKVRTEGCFEEINQIAVSGSATPLLISLSDECFVMVNSIKETVSAIDEMFRFSENSSHSETTSKVKKRNIQFASSDDLRHESVRYSFISQSIIEACESGVIPIGVPDPEQVFIATDGLLWSYNEPRLLTKLQLSPLPFTIQGEHVICALQRYDNVQSTFESVASFQVPSEKSLSVKIEPNFPPSVVYRILLKQPVAPPMKTEEQTSSSDTVPPPATLAACCCVDSMFSSKIAPSVTAIFSMPLFEFSLALCPSSSTRESTAKILPFPCQSSRVQFQPHRLVTVKASDIMLHAMDTPEKGANWDIRCISKISCQNPKDLTYSNILDASVRLNFLMSQNNVAFDFNISRLNANVNENLLRVLYASIHHVFSLLTIQVKSEMHSIPLQIPNTFICNLTRSNLLVADMDTNMPAPDISVPVQNCSSFHLRAVTLTSPEWVSPIQLEDWLITLPDKTVRLMPSSSNAIIISKQSLSSPTNESATLLSISSSLVVANCLNASFELSLMDGRSCTVSALTISSATTDIMLKGDFLYFKIKTTDGMWISKSSLTLRLKSGNFAVVEMEELGEYEEDKPADKNGNSSKFTMLVSLIVDKIESFNHVLILLLPPFVLENDFPVDLNATLTNPHRGKVVCSLNQSSCPYPFCDIFPNELAHLTVSYSSSTINDEEAIYTSSPLTFSLDTLSQGKHTAGGTYSNSPDLKQSSVACKTYSVEKSLQMVSNWMENVLKPTPEKSKNDAVKNISSAAEIQVLPVKLFPFAPAVSFRCFPTVNIINDTSLPLVWLCTDGSILSLNPKSVMCGPPIIAGLRIGIFSNNVLWQSKPIDIMTDVDKEEVFVIEDSAAENQRDYRDNYYSDRISLMPNTSCRFGIGIESRNTECLLVASSKFTVKPGIENESKSVSIKISSFLSVVNRTNLVHKISCSNTPSPTHLSNHASYQLEANGPPTDLPFVGFLSSSIDSRYMDSIFLLLEESTSFLRLPFTTIPGRYLSAVPEGLVMASVEVSILPRKDVDMDYAKRVVIAISDNPFHDVSLRNNCDFDIFVREKGQDFPESGTSLEIHGDNGVFRIYPGYVLEFGFSSPEINIIHFGVPTENEEIIWSGEVALPSLLGTSNSSLVPGGINIITFGTKSTCDMQATVHNYCDTIPEVSVRTLVKACVKKRDKGNVVVKPADQGSRSRRSSNWSRVSSPVDSVTTSYSNLSTSSIILRGRTRTFLCRFDNVQVLFADGQTEKPTFVATFSGLSFGVNIFASRGDGIREPCAGTFQATTKHVQLDNYQNPESNNAFPVILLSNSSGDHSDCVHIHGNLLSRLGETTITSLAIHPGSFSAYVEDVNIKSLVELILSLCSIVDTGEQTEHIPVGGHPLPLQSFSINSCNLELTLRASLYMYIAANQTPLSFGQFKITSCSLTWPQLVHRLTTFYVRGAIFRAGLLVGSLNIIGRPLSLVRTTTSAVRDICYSPFSGRGILNTASSAARSVLADAILSVADFAESVGRNVGQLSPRPPIPSTQQPESVFAGLRQGFTALGLSMVGAIGGLSGRPMEEVLTALESSEQASGDSAQSSLTSLVRVSAAATRGVGLGLVGLVTQPMAGLSEFVAFTGHGLLNTVGQPNVPRTADVQEFFFSNDVFESKNVSYRVEDTLRYLQFTGGHVVTLLQSNVPSICMLLCRQTCSLFDLSERILQQTFFISDIDLIVEGDIKKSVVIKIIRRFDSQRSNVEDGAHTMGGELDELELNKWRIEAFLASTSSEQFSRSPTQSPPMYGFYSKRLMQSNSKLTNDKSQGYENSKPLCSVTVNASHSINHISRFITIFYYLRDVSSLSTESSVQLSAK